MPGLRVVCLGVILRGHILRKHQESKYGEQFVPGLMPGLQLCRWHPDDTAHGCDQRFYLAWRWSRWLRWPEILPLA